MIFHLLQACSTSAYLRHDAEWNWSVHAYAIETVAGTSFVWLRLLLLCLLVILIVFLVVQLTPEAEKWAEQYRDQLSIAGDHQVRRTEDESTAWPPSARQTNAQTQTDSQTRDPSSHQAAILASINRQIDTYMEANRRRTNPATVHHYLLHLAVLPDSEPDAADPEPSARQIVAILEGSGGDANANDEQTAVDNNTQPTSTGASTAWILISILLSPSACIYLGIINSCLRVKAIVPGLFDVNVQPRCSLETSSTHNLWCKTIGTWFSIAFQIYWV